MWIVSVKLQKTLSKSYRYWKQFTTNTQAKGAMDVIAQVPNEVGLPFYIIHL
jgi:hypothetical protein